MLKSVLKESDFSIWTLDSRELPICILNRRYLHTSYSPAEDSIITLALRPQEMNTLGSLSFAAVPVLLSLYKLTKSKPTICQPEKEYDFIVVGGQ